MTAIRTIVADRRVVTIERQSSSSDAAKLMTRHAIGALPVLDAHRLVGIFTERDLMGRVVAADRDPSRTPVGDVMTTDLVVARPEETCETCMGRMQHARVRHLLILDGDRLSGIVSLRDVLAVDGQEKAETIDLLSAYVRS
jgi:CBS domain-containing protein